MFFREKGQKIPENPYTKWFDYDKIKWTLQFRFRETGDYLEYDFAAEQRSGKVRLILDSNIYRVRLNSLAIYPLAEDEERKFVTPKTMINNFTISGCGADGVWKEMYKISGNYQRLVSLPLTFPVRKLRFTIDDVTDGKNVFAFELAEA